MKKNLLLINLFVCLTLASFGQLILDHGPLVNQPGLGSGGADVSALHNNLNTFGFNQSLLNSFRIADSFTVGTNDTWTIDSIIIFSYQSFSGNTSTSVAANCAVYNGSPMAGGTIILGDETTNILSNTYFSGIYRTTATTFGNTDRPIMRNKLVPGSTWTLNGGTYWISWQVDGSTAFSGPWCPPITFPVVTITGNALRGQAGVWSAIIDTCLAGTADDAPQGFPFEIYGSVVTGTHTLANDVQVSFYPNPMHTSSDIRISGLDRLGMNHSGTRFLVYDAYGRLVFKKDDVTEAGFTLNRSGLSSGVYTYELLSDNQRIKVDKFIIQ